MKDPILVTGAARSGTSMVAGIIHICGAFGGDLIGGNNNNPKGMFENKVIRDRIIKPYLKDDLGVGPLGQYPLPNTKGLFIPPNLRRRIEGVMHSQDWDGESSWFYKGAKMCLIWPAWHYAFPNAKWVVVRRRDEDIISSCLNTGFMRAYDSRAGWQGWVDHHKECFKEMHEAGLDVKEVWPEQMVYGDYSRIHEIIQWLGLDWQDEQIKQFIEPKLYKSRQKEGV